MIKRVIVFVIVFFSPLPLFSKLLISEFVTNTPGDWAEIFLTENGPEEMDVSGLFVTMYYGTNEALAREAVTMRSSNIPGTAFDDRYVVVHLTDADGRDETDSAGDLNGNGIRDIYCSNYSNSLWNSDGIVAIDSDDDPENGMIDCVAYSNRDGSMNGTIRSYILSADKNGQWIADSEDVQQCSVDIGPDGLESWMSLCRKGSLDRNNCEDFSLSRFQTPGRDNILRASVSEKRIFRPLKKKIFYRKKSGDDHLNVKLFVSQSCNIKFRVFSVTGILLYESPLYRDVPPGIFSVSWEGRSFRKKARGGMYLGLIEATGNELRGAVSKRVCIVVAR